MTLLYRGKAFTGETPKPSMERIKLFLDTKAVRNRLYDTEEMRAETKAGVHSLHGFPKFYPTHAERWDRGFLFGHPSAIKALRQQLKSK